mgnify:CR=1 FL=1
MENLKNVAPIEDFNWDAYENGESVASASHEELEKAYDNTLNKVNDREVVDGTVIAMNKREVVVNIGYKSDGIIPLNEFRYNPDLKVGDTVLYGKYAGTEVELEGTKYLIMRQSDVVAILG